jgi:hypothetical protein
MARTVSFGSHFATGNIGGRHAQNIVRELTVLLGPFVAGAEVHGVHVFVLRAETAAGIEKITS